MRFTVVIAFLLAAFGCSKDTPTAPSAPPVAACVTNNTAIATFGNRSAGTTHTIQWDGSNIATLGPGQDSQSITVAAGVAHTLRHFIANSNFLACTASNPVLAQCSSIIYTCAF